MGLRPVEEIAPAAYLGSWAAHAGALDLSRFEGAPFAVVDTESGESVLDGAIEYRMDDTELSGEIVYQMDLSEVTTPGEYYIRVPGAGRSWSKNLVMERSRITIVTDADRRNMNGKTDQNGSPRGVAILGQDPEGL